MRQRFSGWWGVAPFQGIGFAEDAVDARFMRCFEIIWTSTISLGRFSSSGRGVRLVTDEFDCDGPSRWLVDESEADRFEEAQPRDWAAIPEDLDETLHFARWSISEDGLVVVLSNRGDGRGEACGRTSVTGLRPILPRRTFRSPRRSSAPRRDRSSVRRRPRSSGWLRHARRPCAQVSRTPSRCSRARR